VNAKRACAGVVLVAVFAIGCAAGGAGRDVHATRLAPGGVDASARLVASWAVDMATTHAPQPSIDARLRVRIDGEDARGSSFAAPLATALLATGRVLLVSEREAVLVRLFDAASEASDVLEVRLETPPGVVVGRLLAEPKRE
jgi:hypothetical protein